MKWPRNAPKMGDKTVKWTLDEFLVQLASEACEVGHAATKCLQFGFHHTHPDYGLNSRVLAHEIGDLLGVCDHISLDWAAVADARALKKIKMDRVRIEFENYKKYLKRRREEYNNANRDDDNGQDRDSEPTDS